MTLEASENVLWIVGGSRALGSESRQCDSCFPLRLPLAACQQP